MPTLRREKLFFRGLLWGGLLLLLLDGCRKEYSLELAAGTLGDEQGNCSAVAIAGSCRVGQDLQDGSFYVTLPVQVTKTGLFRIYTDSINGFSFSAQGRFDRTGSQQVRLKASGRPLRDSLSIFTCFFDRSICQFPIQVADSLSGNIPVSATDPGNDINTWWFTDSSDHSFHRGIIDPASTWFQVTSQWNYLNIIGWPLTSNSFTRDTVFIIQLFLPQPRIEAGTYPVGAGFGGSNLLVYGNNKPMTNIPNSYFYYYECSDLKTPEFIIRIIEVDSTQKIIRGTFAGRSRRRADYSDYVGKDHIISGRFCIKL